MATTRKNKSPVGRAPKSRLPEPEDKPAITPENSGIKMQVVTKQFQPGKTGVANVVLQSLDIRDNCKILIEGLSRTNSQRMKLGRVYKFSLQDTGAVIEDIESGDQAAPAWSQSLVMPDRPTIQTGDTVAPDRSDDIT